MAKTKKRIHNTATGKYYSIRQRTTESGKKGQIKGIWNPPKKDKKKKYSW